MRRLRNGSEHVLQEQIYGAADSGHGASARPSFMGCPASGGWVVLKNTDDVAFCADVDRSVPVTRSTGSAFADAHVPTGISGVIGTKYEQTWPAMKGMKLNARVVIKNLRNMHEKVPSAHESAKKDGA
jgi:hypothetical protein